MNATVWNNRRLLMEKEEHSDLIQTSVKAGWTKFNERKKVTKLTLFRKYVDEVRFG